MKILFVYRAGKVAGRGMLYVRITLQGVRAGDFSSGLAIGLKDWAAGPQRARGSDAAILAIQLANIKTAINGHFLRLSHGGATVSAGAVKSAYLGLFLPPTGLAEMVAAKLAQDVANPLISHSTKEIRRRYVAKILGYLKASGQALCRPEEFTRQLAQDLLNYAAANGYEHNTAVKMFSYLRSALLLARSNGYCSFYPVATFRLKTEIKPLNFLEVSDLERMAKLTTVERLGRVRDLFLLCAYTGFSYAELRQFDAKVHLQQVAGRPTILIVRQKSTRDKSFLCEIPLLSQAAAILEKYSYIMPVLTNQKFNGYLKEIQDILGIGFELTVHCARRTFAMLMLEKKVGPEIVAKMLGHTSTKMLFKHYATVRPGLMWLEMDKLGIA